MKIKRIVQLLMALFIGINFLLVYLDDEGKVERTAYVNDWSQSFETDMAEKMHKPGVLTAASEEQLYFDESLGSFQAFLVEEGSLVNAGDPIYTYLVDNYYETEINLMNEVDRINGEIAAIEDAISQITTYEVPSSGEGSGSPSAFSLTEEGLEVEFPQSSAEAELIKEQYLVEKQKELTQKQAQLTSAESQLNGLRSSGDTVTVESPYDGRVSGINTALENPVVTIESIELVAAGELTESERVQMEQGLMAEVSVHEVDGELAGTVQEVNDKPDSVKIEGESMYPFRIAFEENAEVEQLLPGYHTDIAITMEESLGATAVYEEAIHDKSIWRMTNDGRLVKQNVEMGLDVDGKIEIVEGVETGEWVAVEPPSLFHDNADFITPLQVSGIGRGSFSYSNWAENFVAGLLSR